MKKYEKIIHNFKNLTYLLEGLLNNNVFIPNTVQDEESSKF